MRLPFQLRGLFLILNNPTGIICENNIAQWLRIFNLLEYYWYSLSLALKKQLITVTFTVHVEFS